MNHPNPSDRTHAKGVPQYHLAPCTRRGFTPKKRETNPKSNARRRRASTYITPRFHRRGTPPDPDQSPAPQKCKTNPIPPRPTTKKRKTNPICRSAAIRPPKPPRIMQNEPNFRPRLCETNPIPVYQVSNHPACPTKNAKRTRFRPGPRPKNGKRTQFPVGARHAVPLQCETNPIPAYQPSGRPTFMRNEPNFCPGGQNTKDCGLSAICCF